MLNDSANNKQPLFAEERQQQILDKLNSESKVLVQELSLLFDVTETTIRTDLRELEAKGRLVRTHGGAITKNRAGYEPDSDEKWISNIKEKKAIAKAAMAFVQDGDTIALDTGTTTYEFAKLLPARKNLTVVTNDILIAALLENTSDFEIIVAGGVLRKGFHCTMGPVALGSLEGINVDKTFLASNAFNNKRGFMTPVISHAEVKRKLREIALQVFMLMDSSKIGNISLYSHTKIKDLDVLISDSGISKQAKKAIRDSSEKLEFVLVDAD